MKPLVSIPAVAALLTLSAFSEEPLPAEETHEEVSTKLAEVQDELSADVQQLTIEQTHPKVIELLRLVEEAMDEATMRLMETDTGGETIAAQTDVIEKIFAAAKERQKQSGGDPGDDPSGAMLDMMERMMGRQPGQQPGQQGEQPGDKGGQGRTGESDTANENVQGGGEGGKIEERRIPKAAGVAGKSVPQEFRQALDAYNRGLESMPKKP